MGNTDKFEMIANSYDTSERIHIAKVSSEAIREYLVDTSPNMISQIQQKITDLHIQNVETLCFDFEKERQLDIHADYIFMAQVLLHIDDVELLLSRLYEVLNEGGHLLIVDFDKNEKIASDMVYNGFDQEKLADIMMEKGYRDIQSKTIYTGSKIFMGQDASMFILVAHK